MGFDYSTIFSGAKDEILNALGSAAPAAGAILGISLAVSIGIKIYSKIAKRG
ncbi:hypothetical protein [Bacillus smithii]|uniref:hypothetical protein n=1 Tax=Bacillus smithii TaxID=1479 RepID=UPI003D1D9A07